MTDPFSENANENAHPAQPDVNIEPAGTTAVEANPGKTARAPWRQVVACIDWQGLLLVFLFGSVGGLTYWFYMLYDANLSSATYDPDFLWRWILVLPAVLVLGGFTSLVGVFYITGNKPEEISKAVVLGMVFGFSFNSVLQYLNESQSRALNLEQAENSTADLTQENARLKAELREQELPLDTEQRKEELVGIRTAQADQIIDGLRESTTRSARDKFVSYGKQLIQDIEKTADDATLSASATDAAIRSLGEVGSRAVQVSDDVGLQAAESTAAVTQNKIEAAEVSTTAVQVYLTGDQSLAEIERNATDQGREAVTARTRELRVQVASRLVRGWHNRMSAEQKTRVGDRLRDMRENFTLERNITQLDSALNELAGASAP